MTYRTHDERTAPDRGDRNTVDPASVLNDLPQFGLDYALDDPLEPTEVTVFAPDLGDGSTAWLTADVEAALDLADVA